MKERRSASRQKSFLQGRIFFNDRRTSVDCLVRDFCQHGARLKFPSMTTTPDVVELYIPTKDESYRGQGRMAQWQRDRSWLRLRCELAAARARRGAG